MTAALPVLYSFRRCPYAIRARLALQISAVRYELREVSLKAKPPEMLAASAKGTVPVMVLPCGQVIDESLDIMRWALTSTRPAVAHGWLKPPISDMLALIAVNDGHFKQALDRYKYPHRYVLEGGDNIREFSMAQRLQASTWLEALEPRLAQGWLFGSKPSMADMAILPFVRQFANVDSNWFAAQRWGGLQTWLTTFENSALFQSIMTKCKPW